MTASTDMFVSRLRRYCVKYGVQEPMESLVAIMAGRHPSKINSKLLQLVHQVKTPLPTARQWQQIKDEIFNNPQHAEGIIDIKHSVTAAKELAARLYPIAAMTQPSREDDDDREDQTMVTDLNENEIESFSEKLASIK